MKKIDKILDKYYEPYNQEYINKIREEYYTSDSAIVSHNIILKNKTYINNLKAKFSELVILRNNLAKENGYDSFFEYMYNWDNLPITDIVELNNKSKKITQKILKSIPNEIKNLEWFYTSRNSFNYENFLKTKRFNIPGDVFDFVKDKSLLQKIILKENSLMLYDTEFNADNTKATLSYDPDDKGYETLLGFAHECGHCIYGLENKSDDIDYYQHEKSALEFELKVENKLLKNEKYILRSRFLKTFINNLFEQDIYKNPQQDFSEAYAKAHKKMLGRFKDDNTDVYVLDYNLVFYPCYSSVYVNTYNKLL